MDNKTTFDADSIRRAKAKLGAMDLKDQAMRTILTPGQADKAAALGWIEGVDFYRMDTDPA